MREWSKLKIPNDIKQITPPTLKKLVPPLAYYAEVATKAVKLRRHADGEQELAVAVFSNSKQCVWENFKY
ncbi:MAG: hypothetical protein ACTIJ9_08945 [Aequorivita sp.]